MESNFVQDIRVLKNLPSNWIVEDFTKVVSDISGGNKKTLKTDFLENGDIPVIDQGKELIAGYINDKELVVKNHPPYIVFGDHTRVFKYIDFPFAMGADGTKVLKLINEKKDNPKYVFYFFDSLNIPNTGYNRHYKYLKDVQIPLPTLPVQQKIAAILDAADELRQKDKALVSKYDELTQALFLDMFGDTWTNPRNFPKAKLAEVVKRNKIITYGIVQAGENISDGVPYIRTGDIKKGKIVLDGLLKTSLEIAKSYERSKCQTGDIVMSIRATVGTIAFLPKELDGANLTQGTARISADEKVVNPLFLFHCINTKGIQMKIDGQTKGATFREITLTRLREIEVPVPPLKLQNEFAERVKVIEEQKRIAQASALKSEELFNSLLQKAFNGELV